MGRVEFAREKILEPLTESPEFMDVFPRYYSDVEAFYSWLVQKIRDTHAAAFKEWQTLQVQFWAMTARPAPSR
jgi:hypothetical protein